MRRIPIEYAKEGHYLAESIYTENGSLLVAKGIKLTENIIRKIKQYGFYNIYIKDEYTDTNLEEVIKPQLISKMYNLFAEVKKLILVDTTNKGIYNDKKISISIDEFSYIIDEVIGEISNSKEILTNLVSVSAYDNFTFKHSVNVMTLSIALAMALKYNISDIKKLAIGCLFHDIGKIFIPKKILNKPGKLTPEEFEVIKTHPEVGYNFLKEYTNLPATARIIAYGHHERWDGTGYPRRIQGEKIDKYSRIASVCDVFEALIADRPYRRAFAVHEAREMILGGGGTQFDIKVTEVFSKTINPYPLDTMVRLSDGREGIVSKVNGLFYTRPEVKIYCEENGIRVTPYECDLMKYNNIVIKDIIHEFTFEKLEQKKDLQVSSKRRI